MDPYVHLSHDEFKLSSLFQPYHSAICISALIPQFVTNVDREMLFDRNTVSR